MTPAAATITLADLFTQAGNTLRPTAEGFTCGHEPVHQSKRGACVAINTEKQVWHCRSCGQGGGIIKACTSLMGLSWQDAKDWLTAQGLNTYFLREDETSASPTATRDSLLNALNTLNTYSEWPQMPAEAYYGIIGDFCQRLAPHTEADPVAVLLQCLILAGTLLGRGPHAMVEATRHGLNLFACLVGDTAVARKGTSFDHAVLPFQSSLPDLAIIGGCGSGEGVIAAVQDRSVKREPLKDHGRIVEYQEVEVHAGVTDKRLLIEEQEFSSVLKVASREGNILSEVLRKAWDGKTLRNTVKHQALTATDPHISLVGHITLTQLRRLLTADDQSNGFGNRFLWALVRRARLLPHGGARDAMQWDDLIAAMETRLHEAQRIGRMQRSAAANAGWEAVYPVLTTPPPGLAGTLVARAAPQTVRLSCLYAALDGSHIVRLKHLLAGLAVVGYAMASVQYIFGISTGDTMADMVLAALKESPDGLTQTQIYSEVFQKNHKASEIVRALQSLADQHLIETKKQATGNHRPATVFTLNHSPDYVFNVFNALSLEKLVNLAKNNALAKGFTYAISLQEYVLSPCRDDNPPPGGLYHLPVNDDEEERAAIQAESQTVFPPEARDFPGNGVAPHAPPSIPVAVAVGAARDLPPVEYITQPKQLEALLPVLCQVPVLGVDTETTGLDPLQDRVRLIQLAMPDRIVVVDANTVPAPVLTPVMTAPHTLAIHNAKFDLKFLCTAGLPWPTAAVFDSMLAAQLLGAGVDAGHLKQCGLAAVAQRYLSLPLDKAQQTSDWAGPLTPEQLAYAARDAWTHLLLHPVLAAALADTTLAQAAAIEFGCVPALAWLELAGAPIDAQQWQERARQQQQQALAVEAEIRRLLATQRNGHGTLLPETIALDSPKQVLALLQQRGHALTNTASATLLALGGDDPFIPLLWSTATW
jgi:ribonuclease D